MPLDITKMRLAVAGGLSIVCASCEKWWEGQDKGLPGCIAADGCGSPLAGGTFHEYQGPMTTFDRWCFVCGADAEHAVEVANESRIIGVCAKHLELFRELRPVGKLVLPVRFLVNGKTIPLEKLFQAPKNSLAAAIAEVDAYYESKG